MPGQNSDYAENEAQVRILNNKAMVTISFISSSRSCVTIPQPPAKSQAGCEILQRWLQADPSDPERRFILVTGSGRLNEKEMTDVLNKARFFQTTHLRTFTCQPYIFSDVTEHYEPMANASPCMPYPRRSNDAS
jgi:hypothetical protein